MNDYTRDVLVTIIENFGDSCEPETVDILNTLEELLNDIIKYQHLKE